MTSRDPVTPSPEFEELLKQLDDLATAIFNVVWRRFVRPEITRAFTGSDDDDDRPFHRGIGGE